MERTPSASNSRLTLTFGLRWDPFLPYHDVLGQVAGYRAGYKSQRFQNAPPGAIFPGDPGFPEGGMNNDWNNVSPRFGFAWQATQGQHTTAVRGGYGVFFVRPFPRLYNNFVESAPFSPTITLNGVDIQDPYGSAGVRNPFPPFAPVDLSSNVPFSFPMPYAYFQEDWGVGYSQAWNVTVERQIAPDWLARVAYVGNKGTHLQTFRERNAAVYNPSATVANTNARRPARAVLRFGERTRGCGQFQLSLACRSRSTSASRETSRCLRSTRSRRPLTMSR